MEASAIILAAGRGTRMGADKALVDLGGRTMLERVLAACAASGVHPIVVRAADTESLELAGVDVVSIEPGREMMQSFTAGLELVPDGHAALVYPVDYAMVRASTVVQVVEGLREDGIVLPLHDERPGHPIGIGPRLFDEVRGSGGTLREVVTADRSRNRVVRVEDPWIHRDLDTPEDLAAAREALQ